MSIVQVPSPCPEKVANMPKVQFGFYCSSCAHSVVDFTQKSDEEILRYLRERKGQRTCGIFRNDQVRKQSDWPFEMVRFVAAIALVFGSILFVSSCATTGEPQVNQLQDSVNTADSIANTQIHTTGVVFCDPEQLSDTGNSDSSQVLGWASPLPDSTK